MTLSQRLIQIKPTSRQVELQKMEFYAFVHFTVNTFTNKEWGDGTENPLVFNPTALDAEQWCRAVKEAGMKGLILTCKHHDGFCLWPSKFTEHSVAASPYKNGKGDVVKEVSSACKKFGLKFGIYISPWDRNNKVYGQGKAYDDYFCNQLTELLTEYGPVFCVWLDGACGEGPNGKKQVYDFERYYKVIRQLQPQACISVCGPDVRWCGNEAGHCRKSEWSVVPLRTKDTEIIKERSQKEDSEEFRQRQIFASDEDLGSRQILEKEKDLIWYPAEVNTSIRPGWFYHKAEDDKVRSLEELKNIYLNSAGGNATFLLNIPPTPEGLFHETDVSRLQELGNFIRTAFGKPVYKLTENEIGRKLKVVLTENKTEQFVLQLDFPTAALNYVVLQENIEKSQRIEQFEIYARRQGKYNLIYTGTTVGYKKIAVLKAAAEKNGAVETDSVLIKITACRCEPKLSFAGVF